MTWLSLRGCARFRGHSLQARVGFGRTSAASAARAPIALVADHDLVVVPHPPTLDRLCVMSAASWIG